MSAKTIYDRLRSHGMTVAGACAMLGNMQAESGLKANIAQRGMTTLTDDEYTRQADSYAISQAKFVHDAVGYGLCQWTGERKGYLYDLAMENGTSVGDLLTQCEFIMQEIRNDYPELLEYLVNAEDELSATLEFSNVYLQTLVHGGRTTLASEYLDKYALVEEEE